jgi:hypothetical protein
MRDLEHGFLMKRLYQWLSGRASFFPSETLGGFSRTIRTEVRVERQALTLLVSGLAADFDICPLCGQKLAPPQGNRPGPALQKDSTKRDRDERLTGLSTSFPQGMNEGEFK